MVGRDRAAAERQSDRSRRRGVDGSLTLANSPRTCSRLGRLPTSPPRCRRRAAAQPALRQGAGRGVSRPEVAQLGSVESAAVASLLARRRGRGDLQALVPLPLRTNRGRATWLVLRWNSAVQLRGCLACSRDLRSAGTWRAAGWHARRRRSTRLSKEGAMSAVRPLVDVAGRPRSPTTMPQFHAGRDQINLSRHGLVRSRTPCGGRPLIRCTESASRRAGAALSSACVLVGVGSDFECCASAV